jgi:uncharacterized protein (DUF779 family)
MLQPVIDNHSQICFLPAGAFRIGAADLLLGFIAGCPLFMGGAQFD